MHDCNRLNRPCKVLVFILTKIKKEPKIQISFTTTVKMPGEANDHDSDAQNRDNSSEGNVRI